MIDNPKVAVRHEAIDAKLVLKVGLLSAARAVASVLLSEVGQPVELVYYEHPAVFVENLGEGRTLLLLLW